MVGIIAKKYQSKLICCLEKLARQFYIKYQLISYFFGIWILDKSVLHHCDEQIILF